jgi:hypothetical protein
MLVTTLAFAGRVQRAQQMVGTNGHLVDVATLVLSPVQVGLIAGAIASDGNHLRTLLARQVRFSKAKMSGRKEAGLYKHRALSGRLYTAGRCAAAWFTSLLPRLRSLAPQRLSEQRWHLLPAVGSSLLKRCRRPRRGKMQDWRPALVMANELPLQLLMFSDVPADLRPYPSDRS